MKLKKSNLIKNQELHDYARATHYKNNQKMNRLTDPQKQFKHTKPHNHIITSLQT